MIYAKIMSSLDMTDSDTRKPHTLVQIPDDCSYRIDQADLAKTSNDPVYLTLFYTESGGGRTHSRHGITGNVYFIDSNTGKTISSFGIGSHAPYNHVQKSDVLCDANGYQNFNEVGPNTAS